jgi:hypothetical protein
LDACTGFGIECCEFALLYGLSLGIEVYPDEFLHPSLLRFHNNLNTNIELSTPTSPREGRIYLCSASAAGALQVELPIIKIKNNFITDMAMAMQGNKLPNNFADKVLELESLLDDSLSMDLITDLNELYRVCVALFRLASITTSSTNPARRSISKRR